MKTNKNHQKPVRLFLYTMIVLSFGVLLVAFLLGRESATGERMEAKKVEQIPLKKISLPEEPETFKTFEFNVNQGDTLYGFLTSLGLSPQEILKINQSAKKVYNLEKLLPGSVLKIVFADNHFKRLEYPIGESDMLVVEKVEELDSSGDVIEGFNAYKKALLFDKRLIFYSGKIENSLYEDAVKLGLDPEVIMSLSDIFAWQIDFAVDIRAGDGFKVLYEEKLYDNKVVKRGPVVAAEITNKGEKYRAFYFKDPSGKGDYYDEKGKSLRRQFLKSPLNFRRVSSFFSKRRYHPILKTYRPHHGVDYAAPTGTPVVSTGDGKVTFAGWKKGYGNFVVIRHNDTYSTAYGHLSRIAKGVKIGRDIKQGEGIGYVGSTGISTGPHLHYEFRVRGKPVNPLTYKFPSAKPIASVYKGRFEEEKALLLSLLEKEEGVKVAVLAKEGFNIQ